MSNHTEGKQAGENQCIGIDINRCKPTYDELEKRVIERTAELTQANQLLKQEIAERKLAQEALSAQKEFLQTVIDTNPNQIFVKDRDGKYVLVNQAVAEFHGTTVENLLGKTDAQLSPNQAELPQFLAQDRELWLRYSSSSFQSRLIAPSWEKFVGFNLLKNRCFRVMVKSIKFLVSVLILLNAS